MNLLRGYVAGSSAMTDSAISVSTMHGPTDRTLTEGVATEGLTGAGPDTRSAIRQGYLCLALFGLLFAGWSILTDLPSASIAAGTVTVSGSNKMVQHPAGGTIEEIHVRDGARVVRGEPLLTLTSDSTAAVRNATWQQLVRLEAAYIRATAEARGDRQFIVTEWAESHASDPELAKALADERHLFEESLQAMDSKLSALDRQVSQNREEAEGMRRRRVNLQAQLDSVGAELAEYRQFLKAGLVTRRQIFDLEHSHASLKTEVDDSASSLKVLTERESEAIAEADTIDRTFRKTAAEDANRWLKEADELRGRLAVLDGELERAVIRAPISGTVFGSIANTVGGVVPAGAELMKIVPDDAPLMILALIEPRDRESILPGQDAEIRFTALSQRFTAPVPGKVMMVSADRITDTSGPQPQAFYTADVSLPADAARISGVDMLYPGMQAEVIILTGERTVIEYLLQPLMRGVNRSMRES